MIRNELNSVAFSFLHTADKFQINLSKAIACIWKIIRCHLSHTTYIALTYVVCIGFLFFCTKYKNWIIEIICSSMYYSLPNISKDSKKVNSLLACKGGAPNMLNDALGVLAFLINLTKKWDLYFQISVCFERLLPLVKDHRTQI